MKRIVSMFMMVILVVSVFPAKVYADDKENGYIYAPFTSGYLPNEEYIDLRLKSGFDFLDEPSNNMNWELALTGIVLSREVYDFEYDTTYDKVYDYLGDFGPAQSKTMPLTVQDTLIKLGYDKTRYCYHTEYPSSFVKPVSCFAYKRYEKNGKAINVFAIIIRGTHGGADFFTDILDGGFTIFTSATNTVVHEFSDFIYDVTGKSPEQLKSEDNRFFITGHSLGGAVANRLSITDDIVAMVGKDKNKIYTYTYEAPHTCQNLLWMNPKKMSNAFNFKDVDDSVPNLPPWFGATRYGTDFEFSVGDNPHLNTEYLHELDAEFWIFGDMWYFFRLGLDAIAKKIPFRKVENLDNQIFTTLFPNAKGGSLIEAPKEENYGTCWGHHDIGLPLTYILKKGIENNIWESVEEVLDKSVPGKQIQSVEELLDKSVLVKRIQYDAHGAELLRVEYVYDATGKLARERDYASGGYMGNSEIVYEYDNDGHLIKKTWHSAKAADGSFNYDAYKSDESILFWEEYEYDSAGNNTKITTQFYGESEADSIIYEYDIAGNMIKEVHYLNGEIGNWYEYGYDDDGKQVKYVFYSSSGNILLWREYKYDSKGNEIKVINYDSDGSILGWDESEYDHFGNQISKTHYFDGRVDIRRESIYDSAGNKIKDILYDYNTYGNMVGRTETVYDGNGNKIKETSCLGDGSIDYYEEYQYELLSDMQNH